MSEDKDESKVVAVVKATPDVFDEETLQQLRWQICPQNLTDAEFKVFIEVCRRKNLDPLMGHIYAVKRSGKMTIQTGIDGLRAIAARSGKYAGSEIDFIDVEEEGKIRCKGAKATVYRLVGAEKCAFTAIAYLHEYKPATNDFMWKKMPRVMIAKVAESAALRKAFPEDLGAMYSDTEMEQAG